MSGGVEVRTGHWIVPMGKHKSKPIYPAHAIGPAGTYFRDSFLKSVAYRVLTPMERLVMRDMFRCFSICTRGNKVGIDQHGFEYTFGHCLEPCTDRSFYSAVRRICSVGFFNRAPELEAMRSGSPNKYLPSARWTVYEATESEAEKLRSNDLEKNRRIAKARGRRSAFLANISRPETSNCDSPPDLKPTSGIS